MEKNWWQSKTFWLGILELVIAVLTYIVGLPAEVTWGTVIIGVLTIILRFYTNKPVAGTPGARAK